MKKNILWIDDDIHRHLLRSYIDELEEQEYHIIKVQRVDDIDKTINEEKANISAIIVDIAMPPGENIDIRMARGGLRTGILIIEKLKKNNVVTNVPMLVFTNVDDCYVKKYCESLNIPYLKKEDYFADDFTKELSKIVTQNN